jgi:hypothetical protein
MYIRYHVKYTLFSSEFNKCYNFLNRGFKKKNTQILNFMKIRPVGSRVVPCGQTERQTYRQKHRHDEGNNRFSEILRRAPNK